MRISIDWLRDYVDLPADRDPQALAHDLTMATVEVEQVIDLAAPLAHVIVARVEAVEPHPHADQLRICRMHDGRTVVSGGSNLAPGMKVALALPGAICRGRNGEPFTIGESTIRGVASSGMICSAGELVLGDLFPTPGKAIIDLSALDARPGAPLAQAIGFDDVVFEIDNKSLTNRPDLWGHYGIAREMAALYGLELRALPAFHPPSDDGGLAVHIERPDQCFRYTATRVEGVRAMPAPLWMQSRLVRVGQRPINLLVDLTNYVMMAVGQPSHAFDARDIAGHIDVRAARAGERIALLDRTELSLDASELLIAEGDRPLALAGVMGGELGVRDDTTELWLEVATFDPVSVRRTARRHGLRTESSMRFEKGLDADRVVVALGLFQRLFAELLPESRMTAHVDAYPAPARTVAVEVPVSFLHRRLGVELPVDEIRGLLGRLGFRTAGEERLTVEVPSWRATGDVSLPEDIVEEVARLYGYERLGFSPPVVELVAPVIQPRRRMERRIKEYLAFRCGLQEVVTYPWVESRLLDAAGIDPAATVGLAHPPAPDMRLACSLVPQLLGVVAANLRFANTFAIYELNRVFLPVTGDGPEGLPAQPRRLAAAWVGADAGELFYRAKGALEGLARGVQIEALDFGRQGHAPWADPAASLSITTVGRSVGHLAVLSARAKRKAGIRHAEVVVAELDVDALEPHASRENRFTPLPAYPQVDFDLSLVVPRSVEWALVRDVVQAFDEPVQDVCFVAEYTGAQVPEGCKSLTLRLRLGRDDRTLVRTEIDRTVEAVVEALAKRVGAQLREG